MSELNKWARAAKRNTKNVPGTIVGRNDLLTWIYKKMALSDSNADIQALRVLEHLVKRHAVEPAMPINSDAENERV